MITKNMPEENKVRRILFNEISFLIAGVGLISSLMFWVMNPQQELEIEIVKLKGQVESNQTVVMELQKIKSNDLNEITIKLLQLEERQIQILQSISRMEVLIK
jgi:hypothetical protein